MIEEDGDGDGNNEDSSSCLFLRTFVPILMTNNMLTHYCNLSQDDSIEITSWFNAFS